MIHEMKLSKPWYKLVKTGQKNIEGRIYDDKRKLLNVNDIIKFSDKEGKNVFSKKIIKLEIYKDFDSAIRRAKLKNILPGIRTYKEGVKIYHDIPSYKENAKKFGVILIYLK